MFDITKSNNHVILKNSIEKYKSFEH